MHKIGDKSTFIVGNRLITIKKESYFNFPKCSNEYITYIKRNQSK